MRVKPAGGKVDKVRRSYQFLAAKENAGTVFTIEDIVQATGWKPGTIETYLRKKWGQIVHQGTSGLRCKGVCGFTEAEYVRLMSQKDEVSADPRRPDLAPEVEALVRKSRESALLALHVYNSPATVFRTEGFAVLMVIAWTSLFHAIFEERSVSYFYTEPDGVTPKVVDGDKKAWELDTCMKKFWAAADHATRRNLSSSSDSATESSTGTSPRSTLTLPVSARPCCSTSTRCSSSTSGPTTRSASPWLSLCRRPRFGPRGRPRPSGSSRRSTSTT